MKWENLLSEERLRESTQEKLRKLSEEKSTDARTSFENDYMRIISSSAFRRLQDKAQVFPLERNDFVRTRLTHSIEVAAIAESIGISIEQFLIDEGYIGGIYGYNKDNNILYFEYENGWLDDDLICNSDCLIALDLITGKPIWNGPIGNLDSNYYQEFYVRDDYIFQSLSDFYSDQSKLNVYDIENGNFLNSVFEERDYYLLLANQYMMMYIEDLGIAKGINTITGEVLWEDDEFEFPYSWIKTPYEDIILYMNEERDNLVGLDIKTGEEIWKVEGDFHPDQSYAFYNNLMIHKRVDDHLQLIDMNTGSTTDIYTGGWGRDSYEHFRIIDDNNWLHIGYEGVALIKFK